MALNGNFISFQSVLESVYRKVGYQKIDVNEVIETIGETLRLIGVLPAFNDNVTNGIGTNPAPLHVEDFRVILPSNYITMRAIRKVNLVEVEEDGVVVTRINSFSPMTAATDIFYKSSANNYSENSPGTYNANAIAVTYTVELVGDSGTLDISATGNLTRTVTFLTDLTTSAANFVTAYAADYALVGITVTSDENVITFTQTVAGEAAVEKPIVTNTSDNLNAIVERNDTLADPIIVEAPSYKFSEEYNYTYKINNGYIYTNFEEGYIELMYTGFVIDEDGFPMIPDDQRFIEAIKWTLIEFIDYKKWRLGEISDKVYQDTEQKKAFYIKSAISKASLPSADEMNALKNMLLRSIKKVNEPDSYFKYSNIQEKAYINNPRYRFRR